MICSVVTLRDGKKRTSDYILRMFDIFVIVCVSTRLTEKSKENERESSINILQCVCVDSGSTRVYECGGGGVAWGRTGQPSSFRHFLCELK